MPPQFEKSFFYRLANTRLVRWEPAPLLRIAAIFPPIYIGLRFIDYLLFSLIPNLAPLCTDPYGCNDIEQWVNHGNIIDLAAYTVSFIVVIFIVLHVYRRMFPRGDWGRRKVKLLPLVALILTEIQLLYEHTVNPLHNPWLLIEINTGNNPMNSGQWIRVWRFHGLASPLPGFGFTILLTVLFAWPVYLTWAENWRRKHAGQIIYHKTTHKLDDLVQEAVEDTQTARRNRGRR